ncbi:uncharacterized protein LOC118289084 isoform X3 [Scophthalmus maximus]|nr:uncharacterized protein LOC118289084 isoform X3 [Scophthalmus maximus]
MPWYEERLVRKVLFLSLREFRNTHRATHSHSHSHIHTRARKRTSNNALLHCASRQTSTLPNTHAQRNTRNRRNVHESQSGKVAHGQKNTQNAHISKHIRRQEQTDRGIRTNLSQAPPTPKTKCTYTLQNMRTQSETCPGKITTHDARRRRTSPTRTLRSQTTHGSRSLHNNKQTQSKKHSEKTSCCAAASGNTRMMMSDLATPRTLRSRAPMGLGGPRVNGLSRCQPLLSASPSRGWSVETRPQRRRLANTHCDKDDPANKRPRLQAQRKFAQSPPSSPGPAALMSSTRRGPSVAVVTCLTRRRPKTEDFLSFLCLRGSAALPSNMAFLANGREKMSSDTRHFTSCLSASHRTVADGKKTNVFSRTTEQRDSRSLRGRCSLDPPTPREQCRKKREEEQRRRKREEEQRRRRERMEKERRERAERHLLRPRQLPLKVRRTNKVAMVTAQHRTSSVRSVPPSKPRAGVGSIRSPRPCTRSNNTCKLRGRAQETSNKHLSRQSNHQLPRKQHLPLHHRPVSNHYSNPKTFSSLQNSGNVSGRIPAHMPSTNGSVVTPLNEKPGILRLSRRRRGLPPDTSPAPLSRVSLDKTSSKKSRTLQYNHGDVSLESHCHTGEMLQKEASADEDVPEECVSHMVKTIGSNDDKLEQDGCGYVGEMSFETGSCIREDLQDQVNVGKLSLASVADLEPSQEKISLIDVISDYDLSPVSEVMCRHVREKRLRRNQPTSSTIPKTITSTAATSRTSLTKAAYNSKTPAYVYTDPPGTYSAKHTGKVTSKGTIKDLTKCTSPASSYSIHNPQGAAEDSSNGTTEDSTTDTVLVGSSSTFKGATKGLNQTKSTTSAMKTRTSPRILLKH